MMGSMGQDFVVTPTKNIVNGSSKGLDFRGKCFYSSYIPGSRDYKIGKLQASWYKLVIRHAPVIRGNAKLHTIELPCSS
jgi:hypothetical protein